jgi:hypothetical protein
MIIYRVFIAVEVIDFLRGCRKRDQQAITRLLVDLEKDPFQTGDYVESDEIGRPIQVVIIGRHALYYWADHAVKEVKIVDLKLAGN